MRSDRLCKYCINGCKDVEAFSKFEAVVAEINIKGTEFVCGYKFKLHKEAIKEQLNYFLKR
jgi:hypothetical protein